MSIGKENMKKITLHIDTVEYQEKPDTNEVKKLNKRLLNNIQNVTPKELAENLDSGRTVIPCVFDKFRRLNNFVKTSVVMLDFDNKNDDSYISFEDMKQNEFVKNNASFMYHTFSSNLRKNKYRIVFILNTEIDNVQYFNILMDKLFELFPTTDKKCLDCSHLFFGGFLASEIDFNNVLDWKSLIDFENVKLESLTAKNNSKSKKESLKDSLTYNPEFNSNKVTELLLNFDKEEYFNYLEENTDIIEKIKNKKVSNKKDIAYLFNSLNTFDLFGLNKNNKTFNCILTEDSNPSATISYNDELDMYFYSRFCSEGTISFTNVEIMMTILSKPKDYVFNFLLDVFKMETELPENLKKIKENIIELENLFEDKSKLKTTYPHIYKVLNRHSYFIVEFLKMATLFAYEEEGNLRYLSAKSYSSIAKYIYNTDKQSKINYVCKILNLISYLEFIKKIEFESFPNYYKKILTLNKKQNRVAKTNNIFEINYIDNLTVFLDDLEKNCEYLIECGYTLAGFKQDFIHRLEGNDKANEIYVQTKNKPLNSLNLELRDTIKEILYEEFVTNKKNHILDKDVKSKLNLKYSKWFLKKEYVSTMNQILLSEKFLNLNRKKASTNLKELLTIDADISHNIILIYRNTV